MTPSKVVLDWCLHYIFKKILEALDGENDDADGGANILTGGCDEKHHGRALQLFCQSSNQIKFQNLPSTFRDSLLREIEHNSDRTRSWLHQVSHLVPLSRVRLFATPWIAARQASLSITSSRSSPISGPSSQWCHPAISSSVVPFSSCLQSLPASQSFPTSQPFTWGGQSIGVSASASVLPKKSQG